MTVAEPGGPERRWWPGRLLTVVAVVVAGLVVTAGLAALSLASYRNSEQRLLSLQTQLTADAISAAEPLSVDDRLGGAARIAALTDGNAANFRQAITRPLAGNGLTFAAAALWRVGAGTPHLVTRVGGPAVPTPHPAPTVALIRHAASSATFVVVRLSGPHELGLQYAVAAAGPAGTYVATAEQKLPSDHRIADTKSSPDAPLNLAIYFGRATNRAALLVTDSAAPLPLRGPTAATTVPFGDTALTVVTSARSPLAGTAARVLPWAVVGGGVALTAAAALVADRLARGRRRAERLTDQVRDLYHAQRSTAETLQRALLPERLPAVSGLEVAVRYLPAADGAEIGGDWYDLVPLADGRVVFLVGDVSGHDVRAAAVMASMYFAGRAYALEGHPPADVLDRLRPMLDLARDGHFATVLCGHVDVAARTVTVANAGHLPPLVAADGDVSYVTVPPATPIGMPRGVRAEPAVVTVPPGGVLLAYTDGLVERRHETLDTGLSRLAAAAGRDGCSLDNLLDGIVADLAGAAPFDDIAVIGLKWQT